ncbi:MAG: S41 family peptidase, partial [Candidatus Hodarchaeales archaeon]
NKVFLWSIYPRHFGEDALFRIENASNHISDVTFGAINQYAGSPYKYPSSLFNSTVISDKKIGYLYVGTFVGNMLAPYLSEHESFLQQLSGVDNLIIDVRGNTGGFYSTWIENIVQPLIKEPVLHEQFYAYKKGKHVNYLHQKFVNSMDRARKDSFANLPPEVLTDEYNLFYNYMTYTPTEEFEFNGNITLLIDNMVFSAAEGFANFCDVYDFATIYGTSSGGDGIMLNPQYFVLPNSKIIISSASAIGLDIAGNANEETRTQPDYYYESSFGNFNELINFVIQELSS